MKKIQFLFCLFMMSGLLFAEEPIRTWIFKSSGGNYPFKASLDVSDNSDPETVFFLKDGKRYKMSLDSLSEADQEYVKQARQSREAGQDKVTKKNGQRKASVSKKNRKPVVVSKETNNVSLKGIVSPSNQYILLIGVSEYENSINFPTLRCSVNDIELLSSCFQKMGVPKENIITLTDNAKTKAYLPLRYNICRVIGNLTREIKKDDQLIIAFSGHGVMIRGESYLCPKDADLENKDSLVSRSWVYEQLKECEAKQKIFIVDACQSDLTNVSDSKTVKAFDDPIGENVQGFVVLSSCDKGQTSYEYTDLQHGVFTHFLVEGLSGAVKDEKGRVTLMRLFKYAEDNTRRFVNNHLGDQQDPMLLWKGELNDFVVVFSKTRKAGDCKTVDVNGVKFAFRWIPAGKFIMGSPRNEEGRVGIVEIPHEVTLTKGFWMMETEVTQKQWQAVMGNNPSNFKGDDLPVEQVSWNDCQKFCKKCNELGMPVQLPTEAQWEYACRAGTTGAYAGNLDEMAWYEKNSDDKTHPVGTKKNNPWGIYDMHGNVAEWCQDGWRVPMGESETDPIGDIEDPNHGIRNGSFSNTAVYCRSANRSRMDSDFSIKVLGFRCIMMGTEESELEIKPEEPEPEPDDSLKAGIRSIVKVNGVEIAFRWCPAGTFIMGASSLDKFSESYENQHQVKLSKGFWMMETEVTVGMFKAFVNEMGYKSKGDVPLGWNSIKKIIEKNSQYSWRTPGFVQDDECPVTCVSWDDAVAFCSWLSEKTGKEFQLPTEAQWEYACRAGSTGPYAETYGGIDEMAWYSENSHEKSHPVGTKMHNAWGLFDMHGNVWEWCQDWFGNYTFDKDVTVTDPVGPVVISEDESLRVCRGGSWGELVGSVRSSRREAERPNDRSCKLGFRCVAVGSGTLLPEQGDLSKEGSYAGQRAVAIVKDVEFAFRWCPAGKFAMGSPKDEEGKQEAADQIDGLNTRYFNFIEMPHEVTLTKGFWMMETEVTQAQWKAIMGKPHSRTVYSNPYTRNVSDLPFENVSWNDCQEFCKKCKELGLPVQLPTEAQWEYACRAGTTGPHAGNLDEIAWYVKNSNMKIQPVGTKSPNLWGIYDMHGNVNEWCQDWYDKYDEFDNTDPVGPSMGTCLVIRGGSVIDVGGACRSASRREHEPDFHPGSSFRIGFRCVVMVNADK